MAIWRLKMLIWAMLSVSPSLAASSECLVMKYAQLTDAASISILSLINLNGPLVFVVEFDNIRVASTRDCIELTNSMVNKSLVRDGESLRSKHALPLVIPEGWTNLHLQVVDRIFKLTLLTGGDEQANLLNLTLDFPVSSVHVQGNFALCSGESPEWEVGEGQEVPVPLQPRSDQRLEVVSQDDAVPYLKLPSAAPKHTPINANSTLSIATRWNNTFTVIQMSQDGNNMTEVSQSMASSIVVVGSQSGDLHLRLDLSATAPNISLPTDACKDAATDKATFLWLQGLVLQKKWKNLRDSFSKEMKKQKSLPSGSKGKSGTYIYFRRLQFLESSVASNETTSNIDGEEEAQHDIDTTEHHRAEITPAKKKVKFNSGDLHIANILERSLLARQMETEQQNDEDKLFCLSLYRELKKVPENNRLMTKIELLHIVHRAQTLNNPHTYINQSYPYHYSGNPHHSQPYTVSGSQPGHQTHQNIQPSTSGYNTNNILTPLPAPSPGTVSQASDSQSDYIEMFD